MWILLWSVEQALWAGKGLLGPGRMIFSTCMARPALNAIPIIHYRISYSQRMKTRLFFNELQRFLYPTQLFENSDIANQCEFVRN